MKRRKLKRKTRLLIILISLCACYIGAYKFSQSNSVQGFINEIIEVSGPLTDFTDSSLEAPDIKGHAAILLNASTGEILMEQNADNPFPVASMSKMMTEYIVQEQIKNGSMDWDDLVVMSHAANNMDPQAVKIYVKENDLLTVRDLYNAMVIYSANNATIALAEHIAGSERKFAKLMNNKANKIGLSSKTNFVNSTGLFNTDGSENVMTARDAALLASQLLSDFPDVLNTTKMLEYKLAYDGTTLKNSNAMLDPQNRNLYDNLVDGLKTGFTETAGYCFTGTARKGDKRLISVVMGTKSDDARFLETQKLLSFGFGRF
ncbi:D-alanyl-D-alanine carboxypeptidase family protein [Bacillus sp. FJAT-22090]|uniref:D-alanyl-D-alanine carboxypeptidase family protein n=1 Tax=Bacillus sp. FJAT-22090 TaxID=1581038 RepID=UPI0016436200|nr:D-alanyl-D-alanine carboxypeptidase family protein [Bacillus sp. FJAT-22090]